MCRRINSKSAFRKTFTSLSDSTGYAQANDEMQVPFESNKYI